jgi:pimeloyl-ACP methyl ester carboxylesterase
MAPVRRLLLLATLALAGCAQNAPVSAVDRLKPCTGDDTPIDAYCGTFKVFENRATKQGRQIDLNIVILPALSPDPKPDPLFFLAGGPGQGAAKMARMVREMYRRVQTDRDIVLVDQRGTGKSNPLDCIDQDDSLKVFNEPESAGLEKLKKCLSGYDADLTLYTTTIAMDDLDDVRAFLGYDKINIYGGSYGTRAGLVYMRQHGDRVRAAVLDGVAPTNMRLPLYFPRDVQRALDLLVKDCERSEPCNTTYPGLGGRIAALLERLAKDPPVVKVTHPRTGEVGEVRFEARHVANVMAATLYSPMASALIPAVVVRAEQNDFQGMLALASMGDSGAEPNMAVGMQLSVICAEDGPRVTEEDAKKESEGTLFGAYVMRTQRIACGFWPKGTVDDAFYEPVKSAIPTLVLSGELDPVTPPVWGEQITAHLSNARHVVMPGTGHTAGGTGCGLRVIRNFLDKGTTDGLDTTCVGNVHRPPFFVSPAGPDPTRAPTVKPAS